ncbi:GbpC/Spa domain-containing protein [Lactobacillaceae bacterium L1_55_11]|nr:GbpC/Spa domain-containing protein [Lactobacillaceae bacterium L1_55_11]
MTSTPNGTPNRLKNQMMIGLFSVTGAVALTTAFNNNQASADSLATPAPTNPSADQAAAPAGQADLSKAAPAAQGTTRVPSPSLDQAVSNAQAQQLPTQQTADQNFSGTPAQAKDLRKEADQDYANQVQRINDQVAAQKNYQSQQADISQDEQDLNNQVGKAQAAGVQVTQDPNKTGLTSDQIINGLGKQTQKLADITNEQLALNSAASQQKAAVDNANAAIDKALADARAAGVRASQNATIGVTDRKTPTDGAKDQVAAIDAKIDEAKQKNAEYVKKMAQYLKDKDAVDAHNAKVKAEYEKALAAYNEKIKELESKKNTTGYATKALVQALQLKSEPNAKVTFDYTNGTKWYNGSQQLNTPAVDANVYPDFKDASGNKVSFYNTTIDKGDSITATYTNLSNSEYGSQHISKIVKTFTYVQDGDNNNPINLFIPTDPNLDVWYNDHANYSARTREIRENIKLYDQNGKQITFGDDAVISAASLNNWTNGDDIHIEKAKVQDATFVPVNGSTISLHDDGWAYSTDDNSFNTNSHDAAASWDNSASPDFYKGTAVFQLKPGTNEIVMNLATTSGSRDGNPQTWSQSSTIIPGETANPKPEDPKDTGKYEKEPTEPVAPEAVRTNYNYYVDASTKPAPKKASYHLYDRPQSPAAYPVLYHYNNLTIVKAHGPKDYGPKDHGPRPEPAKPAPKPAALPDTAKTTDNQAATAGYLVAGLSASLSAWFLGRSRRQEQK